MQYFKSPYHANLPVVTVAASNSHKRELADFKCTGTRDHLVVQDAIDEVSAAGGGTVFLLAGDYYFKFESVGWTHTQDEYYSVSVPSNVTVCGEGAATVVHAVIDAGTGYYNKGGLFMIKNSQYSSIRDFMLVGVPSSTTTKTHSGVSLYNSQYCHIVNLCIKDVYYSPIILVNGSSYNTIVGNHIWTASGSDSMIGIWIGTISYGGGGCDFNTVSFNNIFDADGWGILVEESSYNQITNNRIHDLSGGTFAGGNKGVLIQTSTVNAIGNIVTNNQIYNCAGEGIDLADQRVRYSIVSNNIFSNIGEQSVDCNGRYPIITGNIFYESSWTGEEVMIYHFGSIVTSNIFYDSVGTNREAVDISGLAQKAVVGMNVVDGGAYSVEKAINLSNENWVAAGLFDSVVLVKEVDYSYTSPVTIETAKDGWIVTDAWVEVVTAWDGTGATLEVGDTADTDGFMPSANIDLTTTGYYGTDPSSRGAYLWDSANSRQIQKAYSANTDIIATFNAGTGATAGKCLVFLRVIKLK